MYFNSGMALHGATWHDNFGYPMSHGCVNMTITDAHWLFDWSRGVPNMLVNVWRSK
jgi:lipoprotein-anchoring transpeptidase ErfK/SrfK